jgi:predicted Zn-ribbon and HTH transcriptional regulator
MKSSGDCFVDARRTDAIEYAFRIKDDLLTDLKKARHCLDEAIKHMEAKPATCSGCHGLGVIGGMTPEGGETHDCPFCKTTP